MMQMRRIRNYSPTIPINRLPQEVLCIVFAQLRHPSQPTPRRQYSDSTSRFAPYKPLVAAMLVCHKWHAIASKTPSLWTDIDLVHHDTFAPLLLNRSLGASIRLCGCLRRGSTFQTIIANNATRIRELDVYGEGDFFDPVPTSVLGAFLAVGLPRVHVLSVSFETGFTVANTSASVSLINAPVCLPVVKAMFLNNTLFVPAHILPQLTHLCLVNLDNIEIYNILNLLRNAPTLEMLDIKRLYPLEFPHHSATTSLSVSLPGLHSVYVSNVTSATGRHLLTPLEVPNLASLELQRVTVSPRDGILPSMPLFPSTLVLRAINRLAFDFGDRGFTCTAHHKNDLSLVMNVVMYLSEAEKRAWLFNNFPTMLPLPGVEEFHFQAFAWYTVAKDLLSHLAARMPMVSTLVLKHHARSDDKDDSEGGVVDFALAVVAILEGGAGHGSPEPLFPNLAHLELIVNVIPIELCELLAATLVQRDRDGRRLRKLRIRVDSEHVSAWKERWTHSGEPEPNYEETGIFRHVDSGAIYPRQGGDLVCDGEPDEDEENSDRLGWGKWKDCVQRVDHGYWQV